MIAVAIDPEEVKRAAREAAAEQRRKDASDQQAVDDLRRQLDEKT